MEIEIGKPLVLPNGTTIENPGEQHETIVTTKEEHDTASEIDNVALDAFEEHDGVFERTLADLPADISTTSPIMLVLAYSMWGLDTHAIGRILKKDVQYISDFMQTELYIRIRKELIEALRYSETASVHGYLAQKATSAVKTVVSAMHQTRDSDRAFRAAQDILDRSGFRPADRIEHVHKFDDDLRIVHIQEDKKPLTIDVEI